MSSWSCTRWTCSTTPNAPELNSGSPATPRARDRVRQLQGVASMLALEIEPMQASPGLKTRILDAARADLAHDADD